MSITTDASAAGSPRDEWKLIKSSEDSLRYDNADGDISIYADEVSTIKGKRWNVAIYNRLFPGANEGTNEGSMIAESQDDIIRVANILVDEHL